MEHIPGNEAVESTCKHCGVVSDWESAFVDESTVRSGPGSSCITCKTYKDMYPRFYANIVFGVVVAVVIGFNMTNSALGSTIFAVSAFAMMHVTIILHELGHAVAAALLGVKVPVFSFGGGRHVKVFRLPRRWLIVGLLPTEGMIVIRNDVKHWYRLKSGVISAAGPFANLACAGIVYFFLENRELGLGPLTTLATQMFVIFNLITGISNLFFFTATTPHGTMTSDGRSIVDSFSLTSAQIDESIKMTDSIEAYFEYLYGSKETAIKLTEPILAGESASVAVKVLASAAYAETGDLERGKRLCRATLEAGDLKREERASLLNNLAYLLELENTGESIAEADALSEEAFALAPMLLPIRSTRAAVLTALGRSNEAIELTRDKRFKIEPKAHQAHVLCTQAIAYSQLGNLDLAISSWRQAADIAPTSERVLLTKEIVSASEFGTK